METAYIVISAYLKRVNSHNQLRDQLGQAVAAFRKRDETAPTWVELAPDIELPQGSAALLGLQRVTGRFAAMAAAEGLNISQVPAGHILVGRDLIKQEQEPQCTSPLKSADPQFSNHGTSMSPALPSGPVGFGLPGATTRLEKMN